MIERVKTSMKTDIDLKFILQCEENYFAGIKKSKAQRSTGHLKAMLINDFNIHDVGTTVEGSNRDQTEIMLSINPPYQIINHR